MFQDSPSDPKGFKLKKALSVTCHQARSICHLSIFPIVHCDLELTYSPVSHFLMMCHQAGFIGHPYLFPSTQL